MIKQQDQVIDNIDRKQEGMTRRAHRNVSRMEKYLNQTSNCSLYIVLAVELFVFLLLMSI